MFQVYERDEDNEEILVHEAPTAMDAQVFILLAKHAIRVPSAPARKLFIKRVPDAINDNLWHNREEEKFLTGQYKRVPWQNEDWAKTYHFCHVSTDDPNKVAYTASAQHGQEDRQTRMRPGKYLEMIGCPDVRKWASIYAAENENLEVKFAATEDEIEDVYLNGPTSCMSKSLRYYDGHIHPVRVYAAGDLQVAYLQKEDKEVTARCIVWPAKKFYHRVYGDEGRLASLLEAMGYTASYPRYSAKGSLVGARLLKIENKKSDGFIMPYLDGEQGLTEHDDHFTIGGDDYEANETCGTVNDVHACCCSCGERIDNEDAYSDEDGYEFCGYCWRECHFICCNCDEEFHVNDNSTRFNGDIWCESCADECLSDCNDCDETFDDDTLEEGDDGERYCESCIDRHRADDVDDDDEATPSPTVDEATPSPTVDDERNV